MNVMASSSDEMEFFDANSGKISSENSSDAGHSSGGKSDTSDAVYGRLSKVDLDKQSPPITSRRLRGSGSEASNESRNEMVYSEISGDGYSDEPGGEILAEGSRAQSSSSVSENVDHPSPYAPEKDDSDDEGQERDFSLEKTPLSKPSSSGLAPVKPPLGLSSMIKQFLGLSAESKKSSELGAVRVRGNGKQTLDFHGLTLTQSIRANVHYGHTIWCMKFSYDASFLATGDSDGKVVIWSVGSPPEWAQAWSMLGSQYGSRGISSDTW